LRPKDPEQLPLLARAWRSFAQGVAATLRWAGRAILAAGADERLAEHVRAPRVRRAQRLDPSDASGGRFRAVPDGPCTRSGPIAFAAAMLVTVGRLFFVDSYNLVIHFAGLLCSTSSPRPSDLPLAGLIAELERRWSPAT